MNLSNPKAITFFGSLYAVIVPIDAHWATRACILLTGLTTDRSACFRTQNNRFGTGHSA
ncbi:hypothetical protein [uncultured Tateyamaria sp.]|uniref:hypothetical protein n=1 Tax=uncultured Tateyamaria sp. TaxID=455651 RepID=UPI00343EF2B2